MPLASPAPGRADAHMAASAADARLAARLGQMTGDLFLPDEARLSDRTRAVVHAVLRGAVASEEAQVRRHAARILAERGAAAQADKLLGGTPVIDGLRDAGLLRDPALLEELIARVELDLLAEALPPMAGVSGRPGLLARLAGSPEAAVARTALDLARAENRRRAALEGAAPVRSELPAEPHQRLLWRIAAAVREQSPEPDGMADRDRALTEAALRSLATHDEGDRPEAAAERLAAALDAQGDELGPLLMDALADRRMTLFVALVGRAAGVDYQQARLLTIEPEADLLVLLLHAIGLDRAAIARVGVALAEADARRDLDRLADAIDRAVAHDRDAARAALVPLALSPQLRTAVRSLVAAP